MKQFSNLFPFLVCKSKCENFKINFFFVIQEQLKMKDQSLRKLQQEMDSLTFRNQQLAKRVELLQDELALSEARGKKNKVCAGGKKDLLSRCLHLTCQSLILIFSCRCFVSRVELNALVRTCVILLDVSENTHETSIDMCIIHAV